MTILEDYLYVIQEDSLNEGVGKSILGMMILSPPGWVLYRAARSLFSKKSRVCGTLSIGAKRDNCMVKYEIMALQKEVNAYKIFQKECSKQKDPGKCKVKFQNKIDTLNQQIEAKKESFSDRNVSV